MNMFYIAVACQGGCYILACIMNWVVSPFFRASLAKQCHLRYKIGVESINAFYIEIYQKHRKGAENGFTLIAFSIECLESASTSPHKKSLGIQILNSILGQNPDNQGFDQNSDQNGGLQKSTIHPHEIAFIRSTFSYSSKDKHFHHSWHYGNSHYHRPEYPWGSKTLKESPKTAKKINIGG
jgi:hypothetical protein